MLDESVNARTGAEHGFADEVERQYFYAWASIRGIGAKLLLKIGNHFGSFFVAWNSETDPQPNWRALLERTKEIRHRLKPDEQYQTLLQRNPQMVTLVDPVYPIALLQSFPEPFLYYRGNIELLRGSHVLAIVGSRQFNAYAMQSLRQIMAELAGQSIVIVSGLAFGIDALAHRLALDHNLPTIAVLGSSVHDQEIYPRSNWQLAQAILKNNGLLLSPFAFGTPIIPQNFPQRNSTIAGLSHITVVMSAARRSGALITAQLALDAGREVLTIPGNIGQPLSAGTNWLAQQGAKIITSGGDIIEALRLKPSDTPKKQLQTNDPLMNKILSLLQASPIKFDDLLEQLSTYEQTSVTIAISKMELNGWIERNIGNKLSIK